MDQFKYSERGILNPRVFAAMLKTPRHLFVEPEWVHAAYDDRPLPIGFDQTISQPYIVGLMTDLLEPESGHRVLEIGTGSGYQTSILAGLVQHVFSVEILRELHLRAQKNIAPLGLKNITLKSGDGTLGWPDHAPYDGIIVTAAPRDIPLALIEQLKPGGRLVIPIGEASAVQNLLLVQKEPDGTLLKKSIIPVRFVPLLSNQ